MRKTLLTIGLVAAPRAAIACPVCFGENDSPMALAMNMAGVLGAFASFFIYLIRRARRVGQERAV